MSSDLQSALELLVQSNYQSIIIVVAIPYDYVLTFSKEVEYVWRRPWSWVSTMFVLVRYIGLLLAMTAGLGGTPFVPGPLQVSCFTFYALLVINFAIPIVVSISIYWNPQCHNETVYLKGTAFYLVGIWGFIVFLFAADVVMILRVYAMWNQSRTILCILLFIAVVQTITSVVAEGFYQYPNVHFSVTIGHLSSFSFCEFSLANVPLHQQTVLTILKVVPRLVLAATLVILAVTQILKQSVEMYKATTQWQLNRYMQLLVRDGIIYFVMNALYQITAMLAYSAKLSATMLFLSTFVYVFFFALVPRFTISIRELYDRDAHGCSHIDTGFGMRSQLNVGTNTTMSAMVFTDVNRERQDPEVEGDADNSGNIELEEVRRVPGQV